MLQRALKSTDSHFLRTRAGLFRSRLCPDTTKAETASKSDQKAAARQADPEVSARKAVAFLLTSSTGSRWPSLG
jgi:hypothetical protein